MQRRTRFQNQRRRIIHNSVIVIRIQIVFRVRKGNIVQEATCCWSGSEQKKLNAPHDPTFIWFDIHFTHYCVLGLYYTNKLVYVCDICGHAQRGGADMCGVAMHYIRQQMQQARTLTLHGCRECNWDTCKPCNQEVRAKHSVCFHVNGFLFASSNRVRCIGITDHRAPCNPRLSLM